jgi:hypothetical protein
MYCGQCGAINDDSLNFCTKCGVDLRPYKQLYGLPGAPPEAQPETQPETQPADEPGDGSGGAEDSAAATAEAEVQAALKVFDEANLVRYNPELSEAVAKALDTVHSSQHGLTTLLDRLCEGVVIFRGDIELADWGDTTWNELLKKREIIRCLQRAKDERATGRLRELLQADSSYTQWLDIIRPALREAVGAIEGGASSAAPFETPQGTPQPSQQQWAQQYPRPAVTHRPAEIDVKQRHGCLWAWLILAIIANGTLAVIYLFARGAISDYMDVDTWAFVLLGILGVLAIVCAIALFRWKKWGFYGFVGISIVTFVVNLALGVRFIQALTGFISVFVLYGVLQIGGENKGWDQLE